MGIMPDPTPGFNDGCALCFGVNATPDLIKVFFTGIKPAELGGSGEASEYNGYYDLIRNPANLCHWDHGDTNPIKIILRLGYPSSWITMALRIGGGIFQSWDYPPCTYWFKNQNVFWNKIGWKGQCFVQTPAGLQSMIERVTPLADPDPRMECFPLDNEQIVVRYAGKRDATNINIKLDV